jgi:hypothetical protein
MDRQYIFVPTYGDRKWALGVKVFWESLAHAGWSVLYENTEIVVLGKE